MYIFLIVSLSCFVGARASSGQALRENPPADFTPQRLARLQSDTWIIGPNPQNLVIIGPTGSGKSFLAQAIAHHACMNLFSVRYWRLAELAAEIDSLNHDPEETNKLVERISKYHLVILDDFFTTEISAHSITVLFEIMQSKNRPSNHHCVTTRSTRLGHHDAEQSHSRIPHKQDPASLHDDHPCR